jgi:hypothetical protein
MPPECIFDYQEHYHGKSGQAGTSELIIISFATENEGTHCADSGIQTAKAASSERRTHKKAGRAEGTVSQTLSVFPPKILSVWNFFVPYHYSYRYFFSLGQRHDRIQQAA